MKWIKATNLPKKNGWYMVHTIDKLNNETDGMELFYNANLESWFYDSLSIDDYNEGKIVEWLDESEPQPQGEQEGQEELWDEVKRIILSGTENWHILKQLFTIKRKENE